MRTIAIVLLIILTIPLASALNIGVSPSKIVKDNLLPGSSLEETILLSKNAQETVEVQVDVEGDVQEWIKYSSKITLLEGDSFMQAPIEIRVPNDANVGDYTATINYFVQGEENLHVGFSIPIEITVTQKEDYAYQIKHINAKQQNDQTVITFDIYNQGNVESGPTIAEIEIIDNGKKTIIYQDEQEIDTITPFTQDNKQISFSNNLPSGNYWANVKLTGEGQIYEEKVFFEVNNEITANAVIEENESNQSETKVETIIFLIAIGLIMTALVLVLRSRNL